MEENEIKKEKSVKDFFARSWKFIIKSSNGMALGLFATLIVGTIIKTLAGFLPVDTLIFGFDVKNRVLDLAILLIGLMGIGIGVGAGMSVFKSPIHILAIGIAGAIGTLISKGNPLMAYICAVTGMVIIKYVFKKKTPVDIIIIPLLIAIAAFIVGWLFKFPIEWLIDGLAKIIDYFAAEQPFIMGIIVSVLMGMALTAPISSVAIATSIGLSGIAGGAAVVGCSVQMIGFAVMTLKDKENGIGKAISVGVGTSMLQFKNIVKNPLIWLPTIITSAILGPLATCVFKMESSVAGSGMGTCALVGQIGTIEVMNDKQMMILGIILLHFVLPIVMVFALDYLFRKWKLIRPGDLVL